MSNTTTDDTDHHIASTKQFRQDLDGVLQRLKLESNFTNPAQGLPTGPTRGSRERSLAITKLQEAIMWLGMDLKELGTPTPYPNSYNPENTVVDPTADGLKL